MQRRMTAIGSLVLALIAVLGGGVPITAHGASGDTPAAQRKVLSQYATDTWQSFVALTDERTGLPADNVSADGTRSAYTSPTNIGAYIWSTLVARDVGIIKPAEARTRIATTLDTLAHMERSNGFYYNWYDPATGAKLTKWPADGSNLRLFLSSVDNGWLATALIMVRNSVPQLRDQANALLAPMDFGFFLNKSNLLLKGGYWPNNDGDVGCGGFTCFDYGTLNTEPRIASYIGIAMGQIPAEHYFHMWRTFPDACDWSWPEQRPVGTTRTYLGVDVFEGAYKYGDMRIVPSWGGSMFEALMVPLFVPEEQWGAQSWGINHPLYVEAQIEHGLDEARYGYWGFSPSNNPSGGYREYGVDAIGMNPDGYASDQERTLVDYGWDDPACPRPASIPTTYGQGVVTPHASFLALRYAPDAALDNLAKLRANFDAYGSGGFYDAVNVSTGEVSKYYLALDQGMVMAALGNALRNDSVRKDFTQGEVSRVIKPLLGIEQFSAGR